VTDKIVSYKAAYISRLQRYDTAITSFITLWYGLFALKSI